MHNGTDKWKRAASALAVQPFDPLSGAYRNRTDDLLTASQTL